MEYSKDQTIEMTPERVEAFKDYIFMQEDFKKLNAKWILTSFKIFTEQAELDIDNLSDVDKAILWWAENEEERKKLVEWMPKHMQKYEKFLVAPYFIGNSEARINSCLDELETKDIQQINKMLEIRLLTYEQFIRDDNI